VGAWLVELPETAWVELLLASDVAVPLAAFVL
jgi:hypothetical protein